MSFERPSAPEPEGLREEDVLKEQASDYARQLADFALSSDATMLRAAVPQFLANLEKEVVFLGRSKAELKQALLDGLSDLGLDPQLASGETNLELPAHITAAMDAVRAWEPKENGSKAA